MSAEEASSRSAARPGNISWLWFDYSDVPPSVGKFLKGQAERIRRSAGRSIIDIGKDLIAAKHYLSHGAFLRWVVSEVGIPARTGQGYMQVAQWASGRSPNVALLPPTLLYLLSAPSTPQDFILDVLKRTEAGEPITVPAIREELKALRETRRERSHNGKLATSRAGAPHRISDVAAVRMEDEDGLTEVVAILARALPTSDFDRVRDIMTRRSVLDDSCLAQKIEMAFVNFDLSDTIQRGRGFRSHASRLLPLTADDNRRDEAVNSRCSTASG